MWYWLAFVMGVVVGLVCLAWFIAASDADDRADRADEIRRARRDGYDCGYADGFKRARAAR